MVHKILFVSAHFPSKLGGVRRLWHNLAAFSQKFEVHFIQLKLSQDGEEALAELSLPKNVRYSKLTPSGGGFDPFFFLLPPSAWKGAAAMGGAAKELQEYVDNEKIDVVVTHALDCAFALRNVRAEVKVSEVLDSVENYYKSKNASSHSLSSLLMGAFSGFCTPALNSLVGNRSDLLVFVSKLDLPGGKLRSKSIAVEGRDAPPEKQNLGKRGIEAALVGRWEHPPNRDGIRKILPHLGKINGNVVVVGPGLQESGLPENVSYAGLVKDVEGVLSDSKICLVPVWYGAGMQNKVFDALRFGCVVICTPFTRSSLEANGFWCQSCVSSEDLVGEANRQLGKWKPSDAKAAYECYGKLSAKANAEQLQYVRRVEKLLEKKQKLN